jgi:NAD(P)-dependent dehydrogenase (short-subunit alcohol dehydrogenase family)
MGGLMSNAAYSEPQPIKDKWYPAFVETLPSLEAKVVIVTGCTTGTGFVCAKTAAQKGAKFLMLNRKSERAEKAMEALKVVGDVEHVDCDLQSFASVRKAAEYVTSKYGESGVDVLCLNAGVMALKDIATEDGYDVQCQTNHLSHFLLAKELMPLLLTAESKRGEARVVSHSSLARDTMPAMEVKYFEKNGGNLGGDGASMWKKEARWLRYGQSKLANCLFSFALADKFTASKKNLKAVVCAPGLAATNLQVTTASDGGFSSGWIMSWAQSQADGAMPLLTSCFMPQVENGDFWEPSKMGRSSGPPKKFVLGKGCTDEGAKAELWKASEVAVGGTFGV